jgi:hypothetical protein
MNNFSLSQPEEIDHISFGTEFGAIAVGVPQPNTLERYLYFLVGTGTSSNSGLIRKLIIYNNGSISPSVNLYPNADVENDLSGIDVFARELDLSPDGQWLGWASYTQINNSGTTAYRYHYLKLNSSGDLATIPFQSPYQEFNLGAINTWPSTYNYNTAGFRGVEFYQTSSGTKMFLGAGDDGVFSVDIAIPYNDLQIPTFVASSCKYPQNPDNLKVEKKL